MKADAQIGGGSAGAYSNRSGEHILFMTRPFSRPDRKKMAIAIRAAKSSKAHGGYAIGSAIFKDGKLITTTGGGHSFDPTAHNEMLDIQEAVRILASPYLEGCELYSTHAPCPMCMTAAVWAKIDKVVYGATQGDIMEYCIKNGLASKKDVRLKWRFTMIEPEVLYNKYLYTANPNMVVVERFMRKECKKLFYNHQ